MIPQLFTPAPWLITLDGYALLCQSATAPHAREQGSIAQTAAPATPAPVDGLLTLHLSGPIVRTITPIARLIETIYGHGVIVVPEVTATLRKAAADPAIHTVLLVIDSPGGSVNGTPELAAAVRELSHHKHVYAFTAGQMCSAAYWVASQADGIYAAPSARVGSVGVILPLVDSSAYFAKLGLKVDAVTAGKYKGAGLTGTSLTEEQRALLQMQVNETWDAFKAAVNERREIADADMEGQSFSGRQARDKGLVDALANSEEEVQDKLIRRHGRRF